MSDADSAYHVKIMVDNIFFLSDLDSLYKCLPIEISHNA